MELNLLGEDHFAVPKVLFDTTLTFEEIGFVCLFLAVSGNASPRLADRLNDPRARELGITLRERGVISTAVEDGKLAVHIDLDPVLPPEETPEEAE